MKPILALNIGAAAVLAGLLAGCGQPGPLYMPKPPAKPPAAAPAATAIPITVPTTSPAAQQ